MRFTPFSALRPVLAGSVVANAILANTLLVALAATSPAARAQSASPAPNIARDEPISFRKNDREMTAAITKARQTLSQFWAMQEKPAPGVNGFALKVAITEPAKAPDSAGSADAAQNEDQNAAQNAPQSQRYVEHFWLTDIQRRRDATLMGTINNTPKHIKSVKLGQKYTFTADQISDWMFMRNGFIVGAHTLQVMIKRMPPAQADRYAKMLEPR